MAETNKLTKLLDEFEATAAAFIEASARLPGDSDKVRQIRPSAAASRELLDAKEKNFVALRELLWALSSEAAVSVAPETASRLKMLLRPELNVWGLYESTLRSLHDEGRYGCLGNRPPIADEFIGGLLNADELAFAGGEDPDSKWLAVEARLYQCSVIVAQHPLKPKVAKRMQTIRRCFALGLYDAAIVYCRTLVEFAVKEYLCRVGSPLLVVRPMNRRPTLDDWLKSEQVKHAVGEKLQKKALALKNAVNDMVHAESRSDDISEAQCLDGITTTAAIVERLSEAAATPRPVPRMP